jgi:hypothetical protein
MKTTPLALMLALATSLASAQTITSTLYDTGVNGSGTPYASVGQLDSPFTVIAAPTGISGPQNAYSFANSYYYHSGTAIGTATADWISAGTLAPGTSTPTFDQGVGLYTYQEAVTASGAGTFTFTGDWATDNCGTIAVNGRAVTGTGTTIGGGARSACNAAAYSYFETPTKFSFTVALKGGINYLDFDVWNTGLETALLVDGLKATGGKTSGTGSTGVPEPATLALFGLGVAGIGFTRRRKSS